MCAECNPTSGRLRLVQAFIGLSSMPGNSSVSRHVSVARIGKYEIRMFSVFTTQSSEAPQLWMELFDHDAKISIDSSSCHEIDDTVAAFEAMVAQATNLNELRGPEADDART